VEPKRPVDKDGRVQPLPTGKSVEHACRQLAEASLVAPAYDAGRGELWARLRRACAVAAAACAAVVAPPPPPPPPPKDAEPVLNPLFDRPTIT
jgi:hypothetical protein